MKVTLWAFIVFVWSFQPKSVTFVLYFYCFSYLCSDRLSEHKYAIKTNNPSYAMAKHFNSAGHSNETQVKANVIDVIPKNIREGDRHKLLAQKEVFWIETLKYKDKLYGSNEDLDVSFFRHCLYSLLDVTPKMLFLLNILSVMVQCAQWPCHCFFLVYKMWNGVCICVFCKTTCFSSMGLIFLGGCLLFLVYVLMLWVVDPIWRGLLCFLNIYQFVTSCCCSIGNTHYISFRNSFFFFSCPVVCP